MFIFYSWIHSKNLKSNSRPVIGNNVNVGANTVVITDVPDNSIVYGNPCIVKKR